MRQGETIILKITTEELRERYAELDTDVLLNIKVSSELTEDAKTLLEAELSTRNVIDSDYKDAKEINAYLESERDKVKKNMQRRFKRMLTRVGVVLFLVVLYLALK